ncbi:unnamed protein product [Rotaria magnacalcarata]|uniref:Fe2OG dioxygenase domain-containing protein n=1 Tax=Rotaria magnacalcarata TaxID=392030 RepID=A0A816C453_9BILA|nr:unnamed protein product [Rotaria magnacalcarata]CAF1618046.1 unnamed protein product [Rotaria magnacalcarata]CAF2166949.1 unnamed protein product [Rotaria magnacalcarata]
METATNKTAAATYDPKNICELLRRDGYVHLRKWVDPADVRSAVRAINFEIGEGISREEIELMRVNTISFGTDRLRHSQPITNLLYKTRAFKLVQELYGAENIFLPDYYVQIALRFPQDVGNDIISYLPWHLDNVQPGGVKGFGLIVGVFLNDTLQPDSGNFTVFPGGHRTLEAHFRNTAYSMSLYRHKYGKIIVPNIDIGDQHQILANAGDIVICHHQMPHRAAPNISPHIRMAVFFRIYHKHLPFEHPVDCNLRYLAITNLWAVGWTGIKSIEEGDESLVDVDVPSLCDCSKRSVPTDIGTMLINPDLSIPWIRGSKCSGSFQFWESTRRFITDSINQSGTLLDIGCANGFLLASLCYWLEQKSLSVIPYGIECDPSVLQCRRLFPNQYELGHFIQIDLETFLSAPTHEAPAFPERFDFIYWNVWVENYDLEAEIEQNILCKLYQMVSSKGKLLLGLYGTKPQNDEKLEKIKRVMFRRFPYVNNSHVQVLSSLNHSHNLLSIDAINQNN